MHSEEVGNSILLASVGDLSCYFPMHTVSLLGHLVENASAVFKIEVCVSNYVHMDVRYIATSGT